MKRLISHRSFRADGNEPRLTCLENTCTKPQAADKALRATATLREQAAAERERWSTEAAAARAAAAAATAESAESQQRLREELHGLRGTLELSSNSTEGLREALGQRDGEIERLQTELEGAARGAAKAARERDEERAAAAAAAAAAAQEKERLLEQRSRLQAEFEEREARAARERRAAARKAEQDAERRAVEREKEVAEKAEGEAATSKKQLRALSK